MSLHTTQQSAGAGISVGTGNGNDDTTTTHTNDNNVGRNGNDDTTTTHQLRSVTPSPQPLPNNSTVNQNEHFLEIVFLEHDDNHQPVDSDSDLIRRKIMELVKMHGKKIPAEFVEFEKHYFSNKNKLPKKVRSQYSKRELTTRIKRVESDLMDRMKQDKGEDPNAIKERLEGLRWTLRNRDRLMEVEVFLTCPMAVFAVQILPDNKGGMLALRGRRKQIIVVPVEETYLHGFLTDSAMSGERYREGIAFVRKYDRREIFENATFVKARFLGGGVWELLDNDGGVATADSDWVSNSSNISSRDQERIMQMRDEALASGGTNKFIRLDEGSYMSPIIANSNKTRRLPRIEFRNKPGEHLCMIKSAASALSYLGHQEMSNRLVQEVMAQANEPSNKTRTMLDLIREEFRRVGIRMVRVKLRKSDLSSDSEDILLVSLIGKKNGVNHSVAVARGLMFDSNQTKAMKYSVEALDAACGGSGFLSFGWSRKLVFTRKSKHV